MADRLGFDDNIGILDPTGKHPNPLTDKPYSPTYKTLGKVWSAYPSYQKAREILETIRDYPLTFITASTGAGKTVLVPKFALHYTNYQGKIAIILPTKVTTLSAATFSAKTLDVELGGDVGYIYRNSDKKMYRPENKLVYMTDGTLIVKLVSDPKLTEYQIVILDEAHQRKVQIDLILLLLKTLLESGKRPDLKVIIMSATIDTKKYQQYFVPTASRVINISGQTLHDIDVRFVDKPIGSYLVEGLKVVEKLIADKVKADMLFFITTSNEARQTCLTIRSKYPTVYCIEVYADMDQQLKIYAESRSKYLELGNYDQKLIMATNVAESSITIDGLKYVIDSGMELYAWYDPDYMGQIFEKKLISKAQALQRRGRVGRTEPGICFHLFTKEQFDNLADYPEPDIFKQDLTIDLLKVIQFDATKTFIGGKNQFLNIIIA